ncbi:MAG: LpxL/LpxP family Kdo(2)-lipid IV(A) lauroyl/palmitoleoyl acyltransferase [Pseudomonadales bacterium]|nr:LpxL/LpxP family Kdo(2)-lipid IV(A) lauroyl/palmitoleoyl acyltransferase [Pseudomonadales bacterium]
MKPDALSMTTPLFHPKFWPGWALVSLAWCSAHLSLSAQFRLGKQLGLAAFKIGGRRKDIVRTNVKLCFSHLSASQQNNLIKSIFISTGISVFETATAWFRPSSTAHYSVEISGLDILAAAQNRGKGVLLVGAHFATLDLAGAILSAYTQLDVIYRKSKNPLVEWLMVHGRNQLFERVLERKETRQILRRLKHGATIWYAADQDYGRKHSVFVPFFGVQAATITATSRLAQFNDSAVLFFSHFRDPLAQTYTLSITAVPGYPTGDKQKDATIMNAKIESEIRKHPAQYLWLHRRFKTLPEGKRKPYI